MLTPFRSKPAGRLRNQTRSCQKLVPPSVHDVLSEHMHGYTPPAWPEAAILCEDYPSRFPSSAQLVRPGLLVLLDACFLRAVVRVLHPFLCCSVHVAVEMGQVGMVWRRRRAKRGLIDIHTAYLAAGSRVK